MQIILSVKVELVDTAAGSNLRRRLHWLEVASDVTEVDAKNIRFGARARDGEPPVQSRWIWGACQRL